MSPAVLHRYEAALSMDRPVTALRAAVEARLQDGIPGVALLAELDEFRAELEEAHKIEQEEAVIEVMDMLEGWSQPYLDLSR